jgi:hypothetical protein
VVVVVEVVESNGANVTSGEPPVMTLSDGMKPSGVGVGVGVGVWGKRISSRDSGRGPVGVAGFGEISGVSEGDPVNIKASC